MRSLRGCGVVVCAVMALAGCAPQGEVTLEAETLTLAKCEAANLPGASGGKAVLMAQEGGTARAVVMLDPGVYEVTVFVQGGSDEEDAVYVTVGEAEKVRMWGAERGRVCQAVVMGSEEPSFKVTIEKSGPCQVVLEMAETNVYVDRVVLRRVE